MSLRSPRPLAVLAAVLAALLLAACGDTLQLQPLADRDIVHAHDAPYVVYWVGRAFHGMPLSFAAPQTGGSVLITYGNCIIGGQSTCVRALTIVTAHDNSFLPGESHSLVRRRIRGRIAVVAMGGRTIELGTGPVVVDVIASTPALAAQAAEAMTPLNPQGANTGGPGSTLPPALPPNGFALTAS
jgi:hypothetical protein